MVGITFGRECTIMVADRFNSDFQFGKVDDLATSLVLSGAVVSPHFSPSVQVQDLDVRHYSRGKPDGPYPMGHNSQPIMLLISIGYLRAAVAK